MESTRSTTRPVVVSNAFALWKAKEAAEGHKIPMDSIIEAVGLAKHTVRKFMESGGDVSGSSLAAAAALARYFGVGIGEVVQIKPAPVAVEQEA